MKIRLSDLSPDGIRIKDSISLEALNGRLQEGRGSDIVFTSEPEVDLLVTGSVSGGEASGTIKASYKQPCARCSLCCGRLAQSKFRFILKPRNSAAEDASDDIGLIYFDGDHIDLEDALQESLILCLSLFWSPALDESGKCSECGDVFPVEAAEKSTGTRLGALLEAAQSKTKAGGKGGTN